MLRRLDELHLQYPFMGSRQLRDVLRNEGVKINRKRVQRLMRKLGITAVYPKPNTSKANIAHKIYPYLLKGLSISRANQVWCTDITYIPMAKGFMYLVAIMDWHSRKVLSWRLSNTLDSAFCVEALQQAIECFGVPDIFNTDQGCQFTSGGWIGELKKHNIRISMDGKGRWMDNVFIERLWRSVKYEEVYLKAYDNPKQAHASLNEYFDFYNSLRPHQTLAGQTPDQMYNASLKPLSEAA